MNVLITDGIGLIGSCIAERLLDGDEVVLLGRFPDGQRVVDLQARHGDRVRVAQEDLLDSRASLMPAITSARLPRVICSAPTHSTVRAIPARQAMTPS